MSKVSATIAFLKRMQANRAAGCECYLATDPAWLLDVAIGRRAGWAEDPHSYGIVNAKVLPRRATGDAQRNLGQIARKVNSRAVMRSQELGSWKTYIMARIPERFES